MELSYLPGAASLIEQLDKRISIILRDGRNLVGILRSFDQYMNLSVEETFERVIVGKKYADIPLGLYIVRGDNIVLLGEMIDTNDLLTQVEPNELAELLANDTGDNVTLQWDFE